MKCPACRQHTTQFVAIVSDEWNLYRMPFLRTCPNCGAKVRISAGAAIALVALVVFLHSSIEVGRVLAQRYGFDEEHAVICTILAFAVPFFVGVFVVWQRATYALR